MATLQENLIELAVIEAAQKTARQRARTLANSIRVQMWTDGKTRETITETINGQESVIVAEITTKTREVIDYSALKSLVSEAELSSVASVSKTALQNSNINEAVWLQAVVGYETSETLKITSTL